MDYVKPADVANLANHFIGPAIGMTHEPRPAPAPFAALTQVPDE